MDKPLHKLLITATASPAPAQVDHIADLDVPWVERTNLHHDCERPPGEERVAYAVISGAES